MTPREYIEARLAVLRELDRNDPLAQQGESDDQVARRRGKIVAYEDALAALTALEPESSVGTAKVPLNYKPFDVVLTDLTGEQRRLGRADRIDYCATDQHLESVVLTMVDLPPGPEGIGFHRASDDHVFDHCVSTGDYLTLGNVRVRVSDSRAANLTATDVGWELQIPVTVA